MTGMKLFLLTIAVVMFGAVGALVYTLFFFSPENTTTSAAKAGPIIAEAEAVPEKLITNPIVEKAVRKAAKKPTGELTEVDLEKVTSLYLASTQITDAGLKEVAKLQQLTFLSLFNCKQVSDAGVAKLQKALPKCEIHR